MLQGLLAFCIDTQYETGVKSSTWRLPQTEGMYMNIIYSPASSVNANFQAKPGLQA